jgi:hypothetical protein
VPDGDPEQGEGVSSLLQTVRSRAVVITAPLSALCARGFIPLRLRLRLRLR